MNSSSSFETGESQVVAETVQRASEARALSRDDLLCLMDCDSTSLDASAIRSVADNLTRKVFENAGEVHAQIATQTHAFRSWAQTEKRRSGFSAGALTLKVCTELTILRSRSQADIWINRHMADGGK